MPENTEGAEKRAFLIGEVAQSRHAEEIVIFKVSALSSLADFFVVCTADSKPQMRAISQAVDEALSKEGTKPIGLEGRDSTTWLLMDYGNVILHIFNPVSREFYGLDRLWADAPQVTLPEITRNLDTVKKGHS